MKILPTVHIQSSHAVPILRTGGEPCDPMALVEFLVERGCRRLALVDVDAGRGQGHNRELIARLIQRFCKGTSKPCVQVGGGIRSSDQAQFFLDHGASWLLVGTILHRSPVLVDQLLARFRENLTAGLDIRGGEIQASGWNEPAPLDAESACARLRCYGFKRILFTDIPATPQSAPDFHTAQVIAASSRIATFMGGSIQSLEHLDQATAMPSLQGVALDATLLRDDSALAGSLNQLHI